MKMTDAEMDAMVEQVIDRAGRESSMDGMDGDRWDRILVRAALTVRLAADQQKGGGEPDGYTSYGEFRWACDCNEQMKREWTPVYLAPQPSIPAPAKQGPVVDEAVRS